MLPSELISSLPQKFEQARDSGDLVFFPSTVSEHLDSGLKFQVRLCPALQIKPHSTAEPASPKVPEDEKPVDPFSPPYNPNLYLGELRDEDEGYVTLLNKYSVVPEHFLLVTKEYQSQTSPLTPPQLVQIYRILTAARKAGRTFFAFYNCGANSGASQPHKHVQFIPVQEEGPPIDVLARNAVLEVPGKPFSLTSLPYANHIFRFPSQLSTFPAEKLEQTLSDAFLSLLDLCVSTIRHDPNYPPGRPAFNAIITLEHMHLIPRSNEAYVLPDNGGSFPVNSLGFAGMLLVRSNEELFAVMNEGIGKILRGVGLESVHDEQVAGTTREADA